MPIDFDILRNRGCTQKRLREVFTATAECDDPDEGVKSKKQKDFALRERFEKEIESKLMEHINFSLKNYDFYAAVDLAWDSDALNKATYPLNLYAQGKIKPELCQEMLNGSPYSKYAKKDGSAVVIDLPKLFEVNVNLVRSFITRRLAAQSNKYANLWPHFKFESRSTSLVGKLRADIMSQVCDTIADAYNYKHHEVQVVRNMLLYARCVDFVRSAWEVECQWAKKELPEELQVDGAEPELKEVIVKEGVAFVNPHPTRVFWDNNYALSDINSDCGPEYIGYWDVSRYGDIATNPRYWNRDKISYSTDMAGLFTSYAQYFSQYYTTITPPAAPLNEGVPETNDRKNNVGIYSQDMSGNAMVLATYYKKLIPQDWGLGDYPYPVWLRMVVAGQKTVIFAEFMPSTPAAVASYNENDSRMVNVSVAHELMGYQDQLTNLLSYLLLLIKADNIRFIIIDKDSAEPDHIKLIREQVKGQNAYNEPIILEVSRSKMEQLGIDPQKVITIVETKTSAITVVFQAINQLLQLTERMMALSPQEQGQPAPREISATETNLIAGTTESVYGFISDAIDEYRAAKKRIVCESYLAKGNQNLRVPVMNRYSLKTIKAAGFDADPQEVESIPGDNETIPKKHTILGSKSNLAYDYVFTSRDGAERSSNTQAANVLTQLFGLLIQSPILPDVSKEKLYELVNEIFRLSGAGVDLNLELQEGESNGLGPDFKQQIEGVLQQVVQQVESAGQDSQKVNQVLGQLTGNVEKLTKDQEELRQQMFNARQMGAPTSGMPEPFMAEGLIR